MPVLEKGSLVVARSQPKNVLLNSEQLKFVGFVTGFSNGEVYVSWPGVGEVVFNTMGVESIDSQHKPVD